MQTADALRNLYKAVTGSEETPTEDQTAELLQKLADNWPASSETAAPSVDTLQGATDVGKALMKAADREAARAAIAAGTPYTLPAATDKALGGVKKAAAVSFTTDGATAETCATAIAAIIAALKASGAMV